MNDYVMFVVVDPTGEPYVKEEDTYAEWDAAGEANGTLGDGNRLRPAPEAKTVRKRAGEVLVTDGPFTEAREWIAGYGILHCETMDEAVRLASTHPMARFGALEVRQVWHPPFD